jgi:ABC-2 type transport system permease protein
MTMAIPHTNDTLARTGPGFGSLLQSECTKLSSVRSTWIMVALAIGLSIGLSALTALISGLTWDSWGPEVQAGFDPVLTTMSGWLVGMIILIVLSVTTVTSEYNSRMIRTSFIVNPRRGKVFAAKGVVIGLLGLAITAVTIPGMFLVSQPIFAFYGLETASVTDDAAIRFLLVGGLVQGVLYTLIPFSIAWLLRGMASAITTSIGFFFLPWMMAPLFPLWVKENVLRYLPDNAKDSMVGMVAKDAPTFVADGLALVLIGGWIVAGLLAAAHSLNRRDI